MIIGLILAAGESSRMGTDKPLLTYRGHTFLESILQTLRTGGLARLAVVLGHHAEEIQRGVNLRDVQVVINPDYRQGQTSSLQAGIRALEGDYLDAIVLCLVDHPAVKPEVVRSLVKNFQKSRAPVVIPTYQGRRGHPVLIGRQLFAELLSLAPGTGANAIIRTYRDATQFVEVDDPGTLLDVDGPETYRQLDQR